MNLTTPKAQFAAEFIDIEKASGIPGATWETFQLFILDYIGRFLAIIKSRQVAVSFSFALDAVIDSILSPGTPHIMISLNMASAKENIRYARDIINAIDEPARPRLLREGLTELELENGSRILAQGCTIMRGKPRARVYLDEKAHWKHDLQASIYRAALPSISKGDGYIRIGSSPLDPAGLFHTILTKANLYPGYTRLSLPWWVANGLCVHPAEAKKIAPTLPTAERVERYAKPAIQDIFANMILEDFQTEYECFWSEEGESWISWKLIRKNQDPNLTFFELKDPAGLDDWLAEVKAAQDDGRIEKSLSLGVDIGRTRNTTELAGIGDDSTADDYPLRILITLDNVEFDDQERIIEKVATTLTTSHCLIDQNGIGMQLAENLGNKGIAEGYLFSNASKAVLARHARIEAGRGRTTIPQHQDLAYQIHSVRRKHTAAGNTTYGADSNLTHHADKFWAWCLGLWGARREDAPAVSVIIPPPDIISTLNWRGEGVY